MNTSYIPITCSLHDEYEIAIMKKNRISIKWIDANGGVHNKNVLPIDLRAKNREEFLVVLDQAHNEKCIRLDRVTLLTP